MSGQDFAPRKLSRDEGRREQRLYWSGKSFAERLAGATELTRRLYRMRGIDLDECKTDFTPRRVRRSRDHVDILASIGAMPFDQVWRNRVEAEIGGVAVPFISKEDLIANKLQVGRLRDLADAEELGLMEDADQSGSRS